MNEDQMMTMLGNLDDNLLEKEIDKLMDGLECDTESIKRKAHQKLQHHYKKEAKLKRRRRLSYAAAVFACFICLNAVYADEISETIKTFFNKTPVYSTMVDGSAYYLQHSLVLDDSMTIDSFLVSEGKLEMEITSSLDTGALEDMKIVPRDDPNTQYVIGGYSRDGTEYFFSFMNGKKNNYDIRPFQAFDLMVGDKTYSVTLDQAKSLDGTQKLAESEAASNKIDMIRVGANSIEKNGKQAVQLIASFNDKAMKLSAFGEPADKTVKSTFEDLGEKGLLGIGGAGSEIQDILAVDKNGTEYKLEVPADANAWPVTTFVTGAPKDAKLTVKLPALLARYEKTVDSLNIGIPKEGEEILNLDMDMFAQQAVAKSITRISPTSARLVFHLNTGTEQYVKIRSFHVYSPDIKKISSEFNGDTAVMTLEFDQDVDAFTLDISWPEFVINGNWIINMK